MSKYCPAWHRNLVAGKLTQLRIRTDFSVPDSRFVLLVDGVPLGCDTVAELCDVINYMVDKRLRSPVKSQGSE